MSNNQDYKAELEKGGRLFEQFWLRPRKYMNESVYMRLRINRKWGGWKIKDELINLIGLEVGDTISTEITPFFITGLIDDYDDTDLFASGKCADWLMDNNVGVGAIIDCRVRFSYIKAPVGLNGKEINSISLILEEGLCVEGYDSNYVQKNSSENSLGRVLQEFLDSQSGVTP